MVSAAYSVFDPTSSSNSFSRLPLGYQCFLVRIMLCFCCDKLSIDELYKQTCAPAPTSGWSHGYLELHSSWEGLISGAENGCEICRTFRDSFFTSYGGDIGLRKKLALTEFQNSPRPVISFLVMGFSQGGKRPITKLQIQIGAEPQKPGDDRLAVAFRISKTRGSNSLLSPLGSGEKQANHC